MKLPAIERKLLNAIHKKADMPWVEEKLEGKANVDTLEGFN